MSIKKILIVDDSRTELMYLSEILDRGGYQVKTASNADDALRLLEGDRPDLLLLDVVMPGLNGFQLTRQLSRTPAYADIPVILCTSKRQETDRVWGLRQGAIDYLVKPVNEKLLLARIKAL
jgi:twitching motility two-component system response regulator PilH